MTNEERKVKQASKKIERKKAAIEAALTALGEDKNKVGTMDPGGDDFRLLVNRITNQIDMTKNTPMVSEFFISNYLNSNY